MKRQGTFPFTAIIGQEEMKKVNPWALQNIAETLLEAEQRQMWNADDETKEKLQELYLSVEGEIEEDDEE